MQIVSMSPRFRLAIPKGICRQIGFKSGQRVSVDVGDDSVIVLLGLPERRVDSLVGSCKYLGGKPVAELRKDRRREHV
ncbi:MAG: hypothetical protein HZA54_09980 [Planctomycetes bacterium]|nr:hypothetical protein [Planctomycetota bacterium]